jgi:hypothetical protein
LVGVAEEDDPFLDFEGAFRSFGEGGGLSVEEATAEDAESAEDGERNI